MTPEFSRPLALARIVPEEPHEIAASEAERAALALRFGIPALHALLCRYSLRPRRDGVVLARGELRARARLVSAISGEEFDADLAEDFSVRFVPAARLTPGIEIEEDDEIPYEGQRIDLGEAAAEQLALMLPPFPRAPAESEPEEN